MATAMSSANVLSLEEHCERLLQRYTKPLLAKDSQGASHLHASSAHPHRRGGQRQDTRCAGSRSAPSVDGSSAW
jgi:hypothetical protein